MRFILKLSLFSIVVIIIFQSYFYLEIYQNNVILFFKIFFDINTSKRSENIKKFNLKQIKK
jgi:hypothetical protein